MRTGSKRIISSNVFNSPRSFCNDPINRRHALRVLGGAGVASAGVLSLSGRNVFAQDEQSTPMTMPMATPQIGMQSDGSTVWRVKVGEMRMEELLEFHTFFPGEITINEGDGVWFDFGMGAFHNVTFLSGGEAPLLLLPDPEVATPAAGDETKLILNPIVVFPQGGESYDGTGHLTSGIDIFRDPSQPFVLTFTKAGTYEYQCDVHFVVMKGTVVVQAAGSDLPSTQEDYDAIVAAEMAELAAQAETARAEFAEATSTANADGATAWTVAAGAGGETPVRVQSFLPKELEIKVGDAVTWVNQVPGEPHTISFIGKGETPPEDPLEQFADGSPKFVQSNDTYYPRGGDTWSGTGWVSSGFIGDPEIENPPTEYTLTFDTPGEFIYYCALHGDAEGTGMAARLTVVP